MERRRFLSGLGLGTALVSMRPSQAAAQAAPPTVGLLALGLPDPAPWFSGVQMALRGIGYVEGRTVQIELRSARGDHRRLSEMAVELAQLRVNAIVAFQTPAATSARDATAEIPIIMSGVGDPVGTGLVASLSHPGGNVTGMSANAPGLAGKMVDMIRELLPAAGRFAALLNGADPFSKPLSEHIRMGADRNGMEVELRLARPQEDFGAMLGLVRQNGADALFIQPTLVSKALVDLALGHRLPTFSYSGAALGVLATLIASAKEQERGTADYLDKILKGRRPTDLPVSQPTAFDLAINSKTAQALGLQIPLALLARADEVIE